jgi:hypothetical protein
MGIGSGFGSLWVDVSAAVVSPGDGNWIVIAIVAIAACAAWREDR